MSSSLQATAESYLLSSLPQHSQERQILISAGKTYIMPLINATLERIIVDYKISYDQTIKKYIERDFDIVTAIGKNAFQVLYSVLENTNENIVLLSTLILLEENKPSNNTLRAISIAREPLWKKRERTGLFESKVDSTLWWIYCFILFHSHTDPKYDQHFLETLGRIGYNNPSTGLEAIKQESYRVLLSNLISAQ